MLKAVLFDMDGVIIDSEPLHQKAYHGMFKEVGIQVPATLYESFTGQATLNICKQLVQYFKLNRAPEELVNIKRGIFKNLFFNDPELDLITGVRELIQEYHSNSITMVLASSASMPNINNVFTKFDLDPYFTAKLSGADLKASKPHPEIFIKAAEASGFSREECMVIEDSTNGIKAAHAAGIYCTAFKSPHSKNQDYSLANKVISSFEEIRYNAIPSFFQS
ncbi:HAD family hydrolase [Croceitalea rosinachiae]|uniref:HAD-IA family hydrolase n=1 Tax=Croceitalea rosinachiae TaxID=3075596 RepID=A0ABU3AB00_9FLAO|nr:HAD-IA family hydrolase [Croceitalea sp. F388]MDT0606091.1 HAD-IA family hydrolase [Croceitalea sp. F388]